MFRYRLFSSDGDDLGEATYPQKVGPSQEIIAGNTKRFRVVEVFPFDEVHKSPFAGLLEIEAVQVEAA